MVGNHQQMNVNASQTYTNDCLIGLARYLQEPLVIRESTEHQVPVLLSQLYKCAQCSSETDALWVAIHALMLESGFIPSQVSVFDKRVAGLVLSQVSLFVEKVANLAVIYKWQG